MPLIREGRVRFQNNNKLGLARRQIVYLLFKSCDRLGAVEWRIRFQNNKLKVFLARRHTVWDLLFTSRDRLGQGREGKVWFVYVRRHRGQ